MKQETYNELASAISANNLSEAQAAQLVGFKVTSETSYTEFMKDSGMANADRESEAYKSAKKHWNQCRALIKLSALASIQDGGRARIRSRMNGSHGVAITGKVIPGSSGDVIAEAERLFVLDLCHRYFKSATMQSWESGATVKQLATVAKAERRVPYKAYERKDDGSHSLTLKAAVAWVEAEDKRRVEAGKETPAPAPVEVPANVTPITAPRKTAARKTARKAARKPAARKRTS
jgi:hypothetical protein